MRWAVWQRESGSPEHVDSWCHKPSLGLLVFFELFWFGYLDLFIYFFFALSVNLLKCNNSSFPRPFAAAFWAVTHSIKTNILSTQGWRADADVFTSISPPLLSFFHLLLLQWPLSSPLVSAPSLKSETSIYFLSCHRKPQNVSHFLPPHLFFFPLSPLSSTSHLSFHLILPLCATIYSFMACRLDSPPTGMLWMPEGSIQMNCTSLLHILYREHVCVYVLTVYTYTCHFFCRYPSLGMNISFMFSRLPEGRLLRWHDTAHHLRIYWGISLTLKAELTSIGSLHSLLLWHTS